MGEWAYWLIASVALLLGEILSLSLYLLPFGLGAGAAAIAAGLGASLPVQIVVFFVVSGVSFAALRPIAKRHRKMPQSIRTGSSALVGQPAIVLSEVSGNATPGSVKIGGETWSAESVDGSALPVGGNVTVKEIRGALAIVEPAGKSSQS